MEINKVHCSPATMNNDQWNLPNYILSDEYDIDNGQIYNTKDGETIMDLGDIYV